MIATLFSRTKKLNFSFFLYLMKVSSRNLVVCILINNTFINIRKSKVLFETRMNDTVIKKSSFI